MRTQLIFTIFFIISTLMFPSELRAQSGLVGYFPFNGDANDESEFDLDGTINNVVPSTGINDSLNTAFSFNGINSNIYCGVSDRNIVDTVTVSAWIKTNSIDNEFIVAKYNYNEDRGFHFAINEGHLRLGGRNNSGSYTNTGPSNMLINDGDWHHVVAIIYGNTWKIWIDCQIDTVVESNSPNPSLANSEPLTIGNFNLENNRYFDGSIDEVRIYNRILATDEIEELCELQTVSISNELDSKPIVKLFPNPTQNSLTIQSYDFNVDKIEIYNSTGAKVLEIQNPPKEINISKLPIGIYFIKCFDFDKNESIEKEIIKIDRA